MNNLNKKRIQRCRRVSRFFALLPFINCIILNGSLAEGNSRESSDIDLLIIAKTGRIFTARFFVNTLATILGIKRSKNEALPHDGKYCFNYFMTEKFLTIPTGRGGEMDRYCAKNYSNSIFMAGKAELFDAFMLDNQSLFESYGCKPRALTNNYNEKKAILKQFFELILSGKFGDWFERRIKGWQVGKIESDPRTKKYPTLIVYNDKEMRFHPPK